MEELKKKRICPEFRIYMREKYYHSQKTCRNASAFASIYIGRYGPIIGKNQTKGTYGETHAAMEDEIKDITQKVIITEKIIKCKKCGDTLMTSISFQPDVEIDKIEWNKYLKASEAAGKEYQLENDIIQQIEMHRKMTVQECLDQLDEKQLILNWLIQGYDKIGLPFSAVHYLNKERICELYNVELSYFEKK